MSPTPDSRGFSVAHQKVHVDVDINHRRVQGWTELTIVPTDPDLRQVRLDARQMTVLESQVNGINSKFAHTDLLVSRPPQMNHWTAEQHHLYKQKLGALFSSSSPSELVIDIPEDISIAEQDSSSTFFVSHSSQEKSYQPITVKVQFEIANSTAGLNFVGGDDSGIPKGEWHVYTTHSPIGQATSCWLPCVDGFRELCTWELEFAVPKSLADVDWKSQLPDTKMEDAEVADAEVAADVAADVDVADADADADAEADTDAADIAADAADVAAADATDAADVADAAGTGEDSKDVPEKSEGEGEGEDEAEAEAEEGEDEDEEDESEDEDEDEEAQRDIVVICNNNSPKEVVHPTNPHKKVVSFEMFTPISPQHLGFVVGPFVQTPLSHGGEDGENSGGTSSVPFSVFTLPKLTDRVSNACGIFAKAMDYFTRDFGSFPFSSYSLCFVSEMPEQAADAAALSICSDRLLYPTNAIDPMFQNTVPLIRCLAAQWCGVNIVPRTFEDLWVTEGVSLYMTNLFTRKLMGNNEYRFRIRKQSEEITKRDINMPPLADPKFQYPICQADLEFIRLKAPTVLYILDRRMTKTDRSLGLSRVIPKLFLQSMSGDLHSQISTSHFIKLCERVAHHRLTKFFNEWVYGSGYPIFRVTQRFNKKRMFIEMGIGQVQSRELPAEVLLNDEFLERAVRDLASGPDGDHYVPANVFTGPMTIRIHEADGTPYEHVVDLRSSFTKLDIQYNTKYKRLKRNQKFRNAGAGNDDAGTPGASGFAGTNGANGSANGSHGGSSKNKDDSEEGALIHCLGDVLMRDRDIEQWRLIDWGQDDEEYMFNEAFEWIRVDSDFEWIGKMFVGQPDYMYASQLQQDRDVVAQYEAVSYFSHQPPSAIYSSILTRTLMDQRYYYGVRVQAAFGIANCAVERLGYVGKFHLLKIYQHMFCFPDSLVPRPNDFSNFPQYFVQKAMAVALSTIREPSGRAPEDVSEFLLDLIRYNENSSNPYSDSNYLSTLIFAVVNTLHSSNENDDSSNELIDHSDARLRDFVERVTAEIDKCQRLDRWLPSFQHIVTTTAISRNEILIRAHYGVPKLDKLLAITQPGQPAEVRLAAMQSVLDLGGYRNATVFRYILSSALHDPSAEVRVGILRALGNALGIVAYHGEYYGPHDKKPAEIEDPMRARSVRIARQTVHGAIPLLRRTLQTYPHVSKELWAALNAPNTSVLERRYLFELCEVLVPTRNSLMVTLRTPRLYRLAAKRKRDYLIVIKYRSTLSKSRKLAPVEEPELNGHDDAHDFTRVENTAASPPALVIPRLTPGSPDQEVKQESTEPPRPALKLKLGFSL